MRYGFHESLRRDIVLRTDDNKLEAVLNNWIETQCSEVSWDNLMQVLHKVGLPNIAEAVREFFECE